MKDRWFTLYCEPGHLGTGRHNDAIRKAVEPLVRIIVSTRAQMSRLTVKSESTVFHVQMLVLADVVSFVD